MIKNIQSTLANDNVVVTLKTYLHTFLNSVQLSFWIFFSDIQ